MEISIIAHRGYNAKYPENTLLAFQKAIEAKADYIELDVQLTADKELVVFHDYSTKRLTERNYLIKATPLAKLKKLKLGQNQRIPTLQEVFTICKGNIGINIEIKAMNMAKPLNDLISKYQMEKDVIISSFHHDELKNFHRVNPKLKIAALEPTSSQFLNLIRAFLKKSQFIKDAYTTNAELLHPNVRFISRSLIKQAHNANLMVNAWTSDKPSKWEKLIKWGIDGIITNDPESLRMYLERKSYD
jgi:glycerophosphoryl diester phosphodiesterase